MSPHEVSIAVMTNYLAAGNSRDEGLIRARQAASHYDPSDVVDGLVTLSVWTVSALAGLQRGARTQKLQEVGQATQATSPAVAGVEAALSAVSAFLSYKGDDSQALVQARHVGDQYDPAEITDGLITVAGTSLALLQSEKGGTREDALAMMGRIGQVASGWSSHPAARKRGPRSFVKFFTDMGNAEKVLRPGTA